MNATEQEVQTVESPAVQAPVKVPVTTRDVLHRAADLLEEFGWCQDHLALDEEGNESQGIDDLGQPNWTRFCALGAASRAAKDLGAPSYTGVIALDHGIIAFNNAPGRTRVEVVARLREAAERSEQEVGGDR